MKRSWGWILACIVVVCLLWSLAMEASLNPASHFTKHSLAWSRESHSPSSCQSLRVLSGGLIRSGDARQEFFLTRDALLRADDLDPADPPWREFRGPPGRYRDLGRLVRLLVAKVATAALKTRGEVRLRSEFSGGRPPKIENLGFATAFS
jgi:hypothetical protein